jgi:GPH family glycoside/pentoside/hexuronide:cation symporter
MSRDATHSRPVGPASAAERNCSCGQIFVYGLGECANSLVMNGVFGFAMLFFTKALGLNPVWAGIAMAVSVVWEAMFEPIMGHVSDHTRSRWGRRHPYMLVGGLLMALCTYLIWYVPEALRASQSATITYVIAVNLLLRSGLTMFFIPYMALGFEMCSGPDVQARLQSVRQILNMAANFAGPALAWSVYFKADGTIQGTTNPANYLHMGAVFAICTAIFVLVVVKFTFPWRNRDQPPERKASRSVTRWLREFGAEMWQILNDPNARWILVFVFFLCGGMVLVSSLQIFVYDDYMQFASQEKSVAHGSTMIGMAAGAFVSIGLARRWGKRNGVLLGGMISIAANAWLTLLFVTGWVARVPAGQETASFLTPAFWWFVPLHATYWLGNGIMLPLANAMMAEVATRHLQDSGVNKDGAYAGIFSLAMRAAISCSLLASGVCLEAIGYRVQQTTSAVVQSAASLERLGALTFIGGAILGGLALLAMRRFRCVAEPVE